MADKIIDIMLITALLLRAGGLAERCNGPVGNEVFIGFMFWTVLGVAGLCLLAGVV